MLYRFLGTETEIHGLPTLSHYGQRVEIPDDMAKEIILGHGKDTGFAGASALLPDSKFTEIFTDEAEVKKFSTPVSVADPKTPGVAEFLEKKRAALEALYEHRLGLEA